MQKICLLVSTVAVQAWSECEPIPCAGHFQITTPLGLEIASAFLLALTMICNVAGSGDVTGCMAFYQLHLDYPLSVM